MALDTRGFATGFTQGFGMMDQYQNRQKQIGLQEQRLGLQQEQIEYGKEQDAFNRDLAERRLGMQADQQAQSQANWEANHELHERTTNATLANQANTRKRQAKKDKQSDTEYQSQQDMDYAKSFYANLAAGQTKFDEDSFKRLSDIQKRNPQFIGHPLQKTLKDRRAFSQNQQALQTTTASIQKLFMPDAELTGEDAQAIMSANVDVTRAASPAAPQAVAIVERVFDPSDDFNENSPQALGAFNHIFGDLVGEGKRITGVYPGRTPGTISLDLDTPNAKGVPVTANRGTADDGDDEVLEIPIEKAINALKGFKSLSQEFEVNPDAAEKAMRFARTMGLAPEAKNKDKDQPKVHTEKEYNDMGAEVGERAYTLITDPKTGRHYKQYLEEDPKSDFDDVSLDEEIAIAREEVANGTITPEQFQAIYGVLFQEQQAAPTPPNPSGTPNQVGRPTATRGAPQSQQPLGLTDPRNAPLSQFGIK
ncbi:hypothetical protein [Marinomonas atlantica]|uniref:hypothetical protein n=1 Tax=Marinomonas atlantica TaxID=1806668 RepID=UPI00082F7353|nr:hypothetical protein [Marinomonas atlantica]